MFLLIYLYAAFPLLSITHQLYNASRCRARGGGKRCNKNRQKGLDHRPLHFPDPPLIFDTIFLFGNNVTQLTVDSKPTLRFCKSCADSLLLSLLLIASLKVLAHNRDIWIYADDITTN
uniref:Secreted protein n=1 Tax=Glossina palpalis gambiensis TaxID=67801 RepID=A0A1B0BJY0_9MUSC